MAIVLPEGKQSFTTAAGAPGVGYKLYTYRPGSLTPKATYTTSVGDVANTNPVIADARGEMAVYWEGEYDAYLTDASGSPIWGPQRVGGAPTVDPRTYGVTFDGVTDDTAAWQSAITATAAAGRVLEDSMGSTTPSLVTSTLFCPNSTQIRGCHNSMSGLVGTRILFQPTTVKNLFETTGSPATHKVGYAFENIHILGNSTNSTGNSDTCFMVIDIDKSTFRNLTIDGFRTGIRCEASLNNNFDFIQLTNCYLYCVYYTGDECTTDTWQKCYLTNAPYAIQTNGFSLAIRWKECTFESLSTFGVNIVKECYAWDFDTCYGEDTETVYRIGFDGTTLPTGQQARIHGGRYAGTGAGAVVSVDYTDGVSIGGGLFAANYTNVVKTSANTQTFQVVATGWTSAGVSAQVSDATKVVGFYPEGSVNSASRNGLNGVFRHLALGTAVPTDGFGLAFPASQGASTNANTLDDYDEYTAASTACTGAITTAVVWSLTKVGNQVTLSIPTVTGTATATAYFEMGVALPTKYRPVGTVVVPCAIKDNGLNSAAPGMVLISSAGLIRVYKDLVGTANYTNAAVAGLGQTAGICISWLV